MLAALVRAGGPRDLPDWRSGPHRVLYLRYDRIGDMVLATGIIEAIVKAQPTVTVDVLASVRNAEVLRGNPYVGQVLTIDKSRPFSYLTALARARRMRYDAALDTMVMAPSLTTTLLMWGSGIRHRIGVGGRGNDFALTFHAPRLRSARHYVDHSAALLAAFGVDPEGVAAVARGSGHDSAAAVQAPRGAWPSFGWGVWMPKIFLTPDELREGEERWREADAATGDGATRRRLVVNVSSGREWRYWTEEGFVGILKRVRDRFPAVAMLVVGAPEDASRMERIARGGGAPIAQTPRWRELAAIVAASDFSFTADTSVTHVASAFGKPAVALFPRGDGVLYGPYGTRGFSVSTTAPTLERMTVDDAWPALEAMILTDRPEARTRAAASG